METVRLWTGSGRNLSGLSQLSSRFWLRHGGVMVSTVTTRRSWVGRAVLCQCPRPNALMTTWVCSPSSSREDGSNAENKFHCTSLCVCDKVNIWQSYSKFEPPYYCIVGHHQRFEAPFKTEKSCSRHHVVESETSEMDFSNRFSFLQKKSVICET